ncbi:MAG: hypothetical protein EOP23_19020 [Hyphomicrobiales bacterium]|nr:MAG: hypothetical protein EOP23_19020 [Hyphomicrobiales bacterium]
MRRFPGYRTTLLSALALVLGGSATLAAEPVRLITAEEARLPSADPGATQERNLTRGPGIDAIAPPPIGVSGTFRLAVKFKPRNSVAIDPESVRVTYRRQPEVDLTARLKPFVTAAGIEAPAVIVPPGKHVIVIEATDKEGRIGRSQMTLTVAEAK